MKATSVATKYMIWENENDTRNGKHVPTLEINNCKYLQPFRYYRMQVSDSIEQSGCSGDSEVLGLLNLTLMSQYKNNNEFIDENKYIDGFQHNVPMLYGLIDQMSQVALLNARYSYDEIYDIIREKDYDLFIKETVKYLESRINELKVEGCV